RLSVIVSTPPSTSYRICSYAIVSPSRPRHAPELEVEVVRRGPVVEGDGVAPRAVRRDELAAHDAPDAAARRLHPVSDREPTRRRLHASIARPRSRGRCAPPGRSAAGRRSSRWYP